MSSLLSLASLLVVPLVSTLVLRLARRVSNWSQRRSLQGAVLLMPLVAMGLVLCSPGIFAQEPFLKNAVILGMGGIALGALLLGLVRLVLMSRFVACRTLYTDATVEVLANHLVRQSDGTACIRLTPSAQPLALTYGIRRPTILLSTWMVEHLDRRELEAVLAHELEHVTRRDYLVGWLATMLRDAFFYLPTSQIAYRRVQHERELACDDATVLLTQRPLALASALTKVWLHAMEHPDLATVGGAQTLADSAIAVRGRIDRLLALSASDRGKQHPSESIWSLPTAFLLPLAVFEILCLFLLLASTGMGCHPLVVFGRLC